MSETQAETAAASPTVKPSLAGWIARDLILTVLMVAALWGLSLWQGRAPSMASTVLVPSLAFVAAYALCYVYHEWGHLLGARLAGAHMPLLPYAGALLGSFDLKAHSRRQFLWLSWGGVAGYLLTLAFALGVYGVGAFGLAGAGFAVGALAFNVQSLSVDVPQILRVQGGADIVQTTAQGGNARTILRRTWQSWSVLALVLIAWHLLR